MIRTTMCAIVAVCAAAGLAAQAPRTFDVASIRRNTSGDPGSTLDMSRGQLRAINAPLQIVIRQAFEVMDSQIVDAPGWVVSDRYDIIAKVPADFEPKESMRPLMRALLAERFRLATHTEKREMPVYALVKAKADGSLGPNIRQVTPPDCAAKAAAATAPVPAGADEWPYCTVTFSPGSLYLGGYPMTEVTRMLATLVGRTIIDESGLFGPVQFRLQYQRGGGAAPPAGAVDEKPDIFTALQEQTGLKLEARRAPVDVLVIDRIDRPTEN